MGCCSGSDKTFAASVLRWEAFRCSAISEGSDERLGRGEPRWIDTPTTEQKTVAIASASTVLQTIDLLTTIFIAAGPTSGISFPGCKGDCFGTALPGAAA